ncbi:glycopolymer--peptidoglycan transferase LytR [Streptococcus moroccensis]|uniref:LCP family protein required for cell wall assembly n=1 Tax=Streptococcus moroccensis TaxID=1451356 RepID=A0ABT9YTQ9_9STRE|nr:LCP family protein [Streptococcus moroccensis]MDQ0223099.1 LCP family protein required for cell wall assembly [Streptococcus moroccensis]
MTIGKKIASMLGAILVTTLCAFSLYFFTIYNATANELSKTFRPFSEKSNDIIEATEPLTILFMGVDTGTGSREDDWVGNSDSMILVTVNPDTKTTTMMSLERDILVDISEKNGEPSGTQAKLNAAYAQGGAQSAIATVEDMMDVTIDRYAMINMQGLIDLVDAVGGITVNNTFDFDISIEEQEPEYTAIIPPGRQKVNGEQALVYSRMRYQDPEGDYGRQKRQREVIQLIVEKLLSLDSVSSYNRILKAVSGNVQTDVELTTTTIPQLLGYREALENIETYQLAGVDATIDGVSYQIVTEEHMLEMQNVIQGSLGHSLYTTLTTTAILYEDLYGETPLEGSYYGDTSTYGDTASYGEADSIAPYSQSDTDATVPVYEESSLGAEEIPVE